MIPSSVVKAYLTRPLDSHTWIKKLSEKELDAAIAALRPVPQLYPKLRMHQKASFLLGVAYPQFCFWLDMGSGKTLLALELLRYWFKLDKLRRAIIFVTSDKAFSSWTAQLKRFKIDLPLVTLEGSSEDKWQQLAEAQDGLALLPYPGAIFMASSKGKNKKGKTVLKLDKKKLQRLLAWADGFVLDESTRASGDSLTFDLISQLSKTATVRYALAGRPFGRDPITLWAQHYLIDGGETLGETKGLFREAFYTAKKNHWGNKYSFDYTFDKTMQPELARMIQNRSITYTADECIDLPKVVSIREVVSLPEEAGAYYQRVIDGIISAKGNFRAMKNAFMRLRQLSSGFLGAVNDETGERIEVAFDENPKMDRLLELLDELPEGKKAVVFYEFTFSGRTLVKRLKTELGIDSIWLWSGTKDSLKEQRRFEDRNGPAVAVIQSRVGAYSLDWLQRVASYSAFYESPLSSIDREQAERRLIRDGQLHTVFQYDMITKNTADERILAFHREGGDLFDALLRNPAKTLGFKL